jgi:hypothetical protein
LRTSCSFTAPTSLCRCMVICATRCSSWPIQPAMRGFKRPCTGYGATSTFVATPHWCVTSCFPAARVSATRQRRCSRLVFYSRSTFRLRCGLTSQWILLKACPK